MRVTKYGLSGLTTSVTLKVNETKLLRQVLVQDTRPKRVSSTHSYRTLFPTKKTVTTSSFSKTRWSDFKSRVGKRRSNESVDRQEPKTHESGTDLLLLARLGESKDIPTLRRR